MKKEASRCLACWLFGLYLLLFPIDSALGQLLGRVSVNNYVAILSLAAAVIFCGNRFRFTFHGVTALYWAYLLYCCANGALQGRDLLSNRNLIFFFYGGMTVILHHFRWTAAEKKFLGQAVFAGLILAMAVILANVDPDASGRLYLALGRNIDQNYLCANFIFATALLMKGLFAAEKRWHRAVVLLLLAAEFLCMLYLGSRGGVIGNAAVVAASLWLHRDRIRFSHILFTLPAVLLLLLAACLLPQWMRERFDPVNILESGESSRIFLWRAYLKLYSAGGLGQLLFGYGRGVVYAYAETGIINCTHSIYIKALAEGGIVGLSLFLTLLGAVVFRCVKEKNSFTLSFVLGFLVCGIFLDLDDYRIFPLMILLCQIFERQVEPCADGDGDHSHL